MLDEKLEYLKSTYETLIATFPDKLSDKIVRALWVEWLAKNTPSDEEIQSICERFGADYDAEGRKPKLLDFKRVLNDMRGAKTVKKIGRHAEVEEAIADGRIKRPHDCIACGCPLWYVYSEDGSIENGTWRCLNCQWQEGKVCRAS